MCMQIMHLAGVVAGRKLEPSKQLAEGTVMTEFKKIAIGARVIRAFRFMVAALAIGSRTVPLADNSQLRRELSACARLLYDLDEG
jgi:hypothetical protein